MADGEVGWVPLLAGVIGAVVGPVVDLWWRGRSAKPASVAPNGPAQQGVLLSSIMEKNVGDLVVRLEALGDLLMVEFRSSRPPDPELSRAVRQAARDLDSLKIPHPNWHNLSVTPVLAWLPYVELVRETAIRDISGMQSR